MVEVSPPLASAKELITILNRCHRFRGFVYQHAHFNADKKSIEVAVRPRKGSAAVCSRCHLPAPVTTNSPNGALSSSPWLLLRREENLKEEQRFRLRDLLRYNLKTVRAYLLKEAFQRLWDYSSPA
jgi:transposase